RFANRPYKVVRTFGVITLIAASLRNIMKSCKSGESRFRQGKKGQAQGPAPTMNWMVCGF
ncbi:MAG: hypothetical protein JXB48_22960, partial [Candidatus Latescibacteria bacterium]|nr:hypothetical protein [Candidatus Latescibacterota bacterium]